MEHPCLNKPAAFSCRFVYYMWPSSGHQTLKGELFHDGDPYHTEISPLICRANQWTGFLMIRVSVIKELTNTGFLQNSCSKNFKKSSKNICSGIQFLVTLPNVNFTKDVFLKISYIFSNSHLRFSTVVSILDFRLVTAFILNNYTLYYLRRKGPCATS